MLAVVLVPVLLGAVVVPVFVVRLLATAVLPFVTAVVCITLPVSVSMLLLYIPVVSVNITSLFVSRSDLELHATKIEAPSVEGSAHVGEHELSPAFGASEPWPAVF